MSRALRLRHPEDRAILALAVPALGALAADPLYSLADTAFVGNLGTTELGALAVGTSAFTASFWLFSFLAYGVTPRVARAVGAGDGITAARIGVQALWLACGIGALVTVTGVAFAEPIARLLGGRGEVAAVAPDYLRIRMLSAAPVLVTLAGHGWLRGAQDTRTPMFITMAGSIANVVLDYVLIFPLGFGLEGAAWATVAGQTGAAAAFVAVLAARTRGADWSFEWRIARSLLSVGVDLAVRTGTLLAAMTVATAIAARMGEVPLAAWQIAMQVFLLLALTLDSVAIAAQALVGRHLGAGQRARVAELGRRLMALGVVLGVGLAVCLVAVAGPLAALFSDDGGVTASAARLLVWVAVIQPVSALAFTLDGILIGASDTRWLAAAMTAASALYIGAGMIALEADWEIGGLAAAATVWLAARAGAGAVRFAGGRWALQP